MNDIQIADMIFVMVSIVGLTKIIPAIRKVHKVKYSDAHSLVHNEQHIILVFLAVSGYFVVGTMFGFMVGIVELISRLYFIRLIRRKRSHKLTYPSDILYYTVKWFKERFNYGL